MTKEEKTFLDVLAYAEGTLGISNNGYDVLVNDSPSSGSRIILGWTENTDIQHGLNNWKVKVGNVFSTAAGRYQFIGSSWIQYNNNNNAPMTKINQDKAALKYLKQLLGSTYSFKINDENDMKMVADKIKNVWSSFKVKSAAELYKIYKNAIILYK